MRCHCVSTSLYEMSQYRYDQVHHQQKNPEQNKIQNRSQNKWNKLGETSLKHTPIKEQHHQTIREHSAQVRDVRGVGSVVHFNHHHHHHQLIINGHVLVEKPFVSKTHVLHNCNSVQ